MTRSQLIVTTAAQTKLPAAEVEAVLDAVCDSIIDTLSEGEKVTIAGFGRFEMRQRKTKAYTNPKTKQISQLAPVSTPGFKPSGLMKERTCKK